jgi:hypothetical protein
VAVVFSVRCYLDIFPTSLINLCHTALPINSPAEVARDYRWAQFGQTLNTHSQIPPHGSSKMDCITTSEEYVTIWRQEKSPGGSQRREDPCRQGFQRQQVTHEVFELDREPWNSHSTKTLPSD